MVKHLEMEIFKNYYAVRGYFNEFVKHIMLRVLLSKVYNRKALLAIF